MVASDLQILENIARSAHFAAMVMCFILVVSADLNAAKSAFWPLNERDFNRLHRNHAALTSGLILLWLSGLFLIWRGTAFDIAQFSPKLIAKVFVVTMLTANAVVIGRVALPFFERNKGKTFGDFSFVIRLCLGCCAAMSAASWVSAFCLGAIPWLKTASPIELVSFLGPIYAVCVAAASLFAVVCARDKTRFELAEPSHLVIGAPRGLSRANMFPSRFSSVSSRL